MTVASPDQIRALVEVHFTRAFSGEFMSLTELHEFIAPIIDMLGIDSFTTRLPWQIEFQGGEIIEGLSENLKFAAQDISAQLSRMLAMGIAAETQVALSVSDARLQSDMPPLLPLGVVNA